MDLFSNASLDQFPNNTVAQFQVSLEHPLMLDGSYECALAEMICPRTAVIGKGQSPPIKLYIQCYPETQEEIDAGFPSRSSVVFSSNSEHFLKARKPDPNVEVTETQYRADSIIGNRPFAFPFTFKLDEFNTFGEFLDFFKTLFKGEAESNLRESGLTEREKKENMVVRKIIKRRVLGSSYSLGFFPKNNEMVLKIRDSDMKIAIPSALTRLMGIEVAEGQWTVYLKPGKYVVPALMNRDDPLHGVRPNLVAIYSNIIRPIAVGNVTAPLLRVCRLPKDNDIDLHTFEFSNQHFMPVGMTFIQVIDVELRGNDGSLVPFANTGVTYLRLHFRKRR